MKQEAQVGKFVGRPMERVEDASLLAGQALFCDDLPVRPDTLHAAHLRSPHAQAEIGSIDTSAALAHPGGFARLFRGCS